MYVIAFDVPREAIDEKAGLPEGELFRYERDPYILFPSFQVWGDDRASPRSSLMDLIYLTPRPTLFSSRRPNNSSRTE